MPLLSLAGVPRVFLVNNAIFLVTGWFMILGNQQLGYYQANSPYSFLAGVAQYSGMLLLGLAWMAVDWKFFRGPKPLHRGLHLRRLLPVAIPDLCDTFFTIFGILNLGSGLFIIIFSFVTVLAALIRWAFLKKKLYWWQWAAIFAITGVLIATAGNPANGGGKGHATGVICTLVATLMDAVMYVSAEHALNPTKGSGVPGRLSSRMRLSESAAGTELRTELSAGESSSEAVTPAEIVVVVGLVNLPVVLLYVQRAPLRLAPLPLFVALLYYAASISRDRCTPRYCCDIVDCDWCVRPDTLSASRSSASGTRTWLIRSSTTVCLTLSPAQR